MGNTQTPARAGSAVLGIDAAWTSRHESGVALVSQDNGAWRCIVVGPNYEQFVEHSQKAGMTPSNRRHRVDLRDVIDAARQAAPNDVDVIAVDMPLSTAPITGRRSADDLISRHFGALGCGTHSPSRGRPGAISFAMIKTFGGLGYDLRTGSSESKQKAVIEVFPHPALLALCNCSYRLPYKVGKRHKYWPKETPYARRGKIVQEMQGILQALKREIRDIPLDLNATTENLPITDLKAIEDMVDSLVCAWVGIKYLAGEADPYGDDTAAIWVPRRASPGDSLVTVTNDGAA